MNCSITQQQLIPHPWSRRRALSFGSRNSIVNLLRSLKNSHGFELFEHRLKIFELSAMNTQVTLNGTVIQKLGQNGLNAAFCLPISYLRVIS